MRRLAWISLVVLAGCLSPAAQSSSTSGPLASTQPDEAARVAPTAAWLAEMDNGALAPGPGELEVELKDGEPSRLELAALRVDVRTAGSMARYEVEHVFVNHGDQQLEGSFRFPLPSGSIVTGLAMEIDGQLMDGEILERSRAREIYEEIVDGMRDPALLEWEAGQTFKLRVFPIAPREHKRVIMRYMAPLLPDEAAPSGFAVAVPTAVPAMQTTIGALAVTLDGELELEASEHETRENLRLAIPAVATPGYVEERDAGQRYLAARVDLDWSQVPAATRVPSRRRTVIVVDSSRSALESWALARQAVATVLDSLAPADEFALIVGDLETRSFAPEFVGNGPEARRAALEFLAGIEPDGASDLGRALAAVGDALAEGPEGDDATLDQVVYVGDGTATWGTTEPAALVELAREALDGAPLYAVSVGKRESRDTLEALTGATGGRTVRPETLAQVEAFGAFLERAPRVRRIAEVVVEVPGVPQLRGPISKTWFEGERPTVHFRVPDDQPLPHELVVRGAANGELFTQTIALGEPRATVGVRQQWAARELAVTTDKAAAVALSVEHSVLSKHTALLVLESEEAYERYAIERRNERAVARRAGDVPEVSGRDLDGDDAAPYLGPGDLQPGDPEIFIPAPRDAISVEVMFPFGDTKSARWDDGIGQWSTRFLVDDDVAPGTYAVTVRVTHADGRVELLELEYTIDVEAPTLELELRAREDGAYDVFARQILTAADAARERPEGRVGDERARTLDARRVELIMPDGQTLQLRRGLDGQFVRRWQPREPVRWPATVSAVIGDRALNYRRVELPLDLPGEGRR